MWVGMHFCCFGGGGRGWGIGSCCRSRSGPIYPVWACRCLAAAACGSLDFPRPEPGTACLDLLTGPQTSLFSNFERLSPGPHQVNRAGPHRIDRASPHQTNRASARANKIELTIRPIEIEQTIRPIKTWPIEIGPNRL